MATSVEGDVLMPTSTFKQSLPSSLSPSDPSIFSDKEGTSGSKKGRVCVPGQLLYRTDASTKAGGNFQAGGGCYEFHSAIYASLCGIVYVYLLKETVSRFSYC